MNHKSSDFDGRQFAKMREALACFRGMPVSIDALCRLISTLDFLIEALQDRETATLGHLRHSWGILEEVYAVALDEGRKALSANDGNLIQKALSELENELESQEAPADEL